MMTTEDMMQIDATGGGEDDRGAAEEERYLMTVRSLEDQGYVDARTKGLLLEEQDRRRRRAAPADDDDDRSSSTSSSSSSSSSSSLEDVPPGSFHFVWNGRQHSVDDVRALVHVRVVNPGAFCIYDPVWSDELRTAIVDAFRHFAERGIYWTTLVLGHHRWQAGGGGAAVNFFDRRYVRPILFVANAFRLFQRFEFWGETWTPAASSAADPSGEASILSGLEWNDRLEAVLLQVNEGMTPGDHLALNRTLRNDRGRLKELVLRCSDLNHGLLSEGLAKNGTLVHLDLDFRQPDTDDGVGIGSILGALAIHPKLRKFELATGDRFGDYSAELGTMLETSRSIQELALVGCTDRNFLDTGNVLRGLRSTRSLRKLTIVSSLTGDFVFSEILRTLRESPCCPLEVLSLWYLASERDFERMKTCDRLERPIEVEMHSRDLRRHERILEGVLERHPEIRLFGEIPGSLDYITDLNWYGRYLLDRRQTPLSLWPSVLQNANHNESVLYEWLKGPAFAGRDIFL